MAATRYMVMVRYIHPKSNRPIMNDTTIEFKKNENGAYFVKSSSAYNTGKSYLATNWVNERLDVEKNTMYDHLYIFDSTKKPLDLSFDAGVGPAGEYPYIVMDWYERVAMEPWFPMSIFGSLNMALEKCKDLADKIGLSNVKLIKMVPIGQKIKIV